VDGDVTIRWRRNGVYIDEGLDELRGRHVVLPSGNLRIEPVIHGAGGGVGEGDEGLYECVAEHPRMGRVVSLPAKLLVACE